MKNKNNCKYDEIFSNKKTEEIKSQISDSFTNEKGDTIRTVGGKEIKQIEEKTEADRRKNEAINSWRLRNK